jgi:hypothetical protein
MNPKIPNVYGIIADSAKNIPAGIDDFKIFLRNDPDIFSEKGSIASKNEPSPATPKDIPSMF